MSRRRVAYVTAVLSVTLAVPPSPAAPAEAVWVPTRPLPTVAVWGLNAFRDGTVYALTMTQGATVELLRSGDHGMTWAAMPATAWPRDVGLYRLTMATRLAGFGFGYRAPGHAFAYGALTATTDGMRTWVTRPLPRAPLAQSLNASSLATSPSGRSAVVSGVTFNGLTHSPGAEVVFASDQGRTMRRAHLGVSVNTWATAALIDDRTAVVAVREGLFPLELGTPSVDGVTVPLADT